MNEESLLLARKVVFGEKRCEAVAILHCVKNDWRNNTLQNLNTRRVQAIIRSHG